MTPPNSVADRNLLFGILALQLDFIQRDALVEAMHAWILDKGKSLGEILRGQGRLSAERLALLEALVAEHLKQHAGDPQQSLAAVSSLGPLRQDLEAIADPDVQTTLARVTIVPPECRDDPDATLAVGASSSQGQRFRILRPFAKGGLGQVSVAQDLELHRDVALKEIQPQYADDGESRSRFVLEAEITGALEHPGIVPVYGLGQYADGRPFYAMRFIRGENLQDAIRHYHSPEQQQRSDAERTLELRQLLGRFIDVCNAIDYAHSRGVLHRDLKPGNVMLGKYGETLVVDWGLAKPVGAAPAPRTAVESLIRPASGNGSTPTQMGAAVGTPSYMSPEQAAGRHDLLGKASDVYSLGATLYHLLTGRPSLEGHDVGKILQQAERGEFPRPREIYPRVPTGLEAICLKAMALSPDQRYGSAGDLAKDVEQWLADEPVAALPESWAQRVGRWARRHRSWTQAAAVALVAVAVVSAASAVLVVRAQKKEAQAWELSAKTREFDLRLLQEKEWDEEKLGDLEQATDEIARLSPPDAELRRTRLYEAFAGELKAALETPRFADEDRARFDGRLKVLKARAATPNPRAEQLVAELESARDARLARWDSLFDLQAPFGESHLAVFDPERVTSDDEAGLHPVAASLKADYAVLSSVPCPPGNLELKGVFGRGWLDSPVVGLLLNSSEKHSYAFLVATPQFDYRDATPDELQQLPTLGETLNQRGGGQLDMYILRDGRPLRKSPVSITTGRLRLLARREGGTLSFTVNDVHTIKFDDPFPLADGESGVFGVYWPANVHLERLQALRLRAPRNLSPIEAGDQLYSRGEFADALAAFRSQDALEARYKTALCQLSLGEVKSGLDALVEISSEATGVEKTSDDPWRLRAGCRLLEHHVEQRQWDDVRRMLKELSDYFDREQVVRLIPNTQHELILQRFRRTGNRTRFWNTASNAVEDLKWALLVEELFNESAAERRMTKWRLADAYRWEQKPAEARQILDELIGADDPRDPVPIVERIALVEDLAWMLTENNDFAGAQSELDRWLLDADGEYRTEYLPLLVNRAVTHVNLGAPDKAVQDLDRFFAEVPVKSIDHSKFARACALRGMLYEDEGKPAEAQKVWRQGLRRNWHEGYLDPKDKVRRRGLQMVLAGESLSADEVLASWTGELTEDEAVRMVWNNAPGSGFLSTSLRRLVESAVEPALTRGTFLRMFTSPQGRAHARRGFLGRNPMHGVSSSQFGFVEVAKLGCLSDVEITPEFDELIFASCHRLIQHWYDGDWGEDVLQEILTMWRGNFSRRGFAKLEQIGTIDPELFESMCALVGNRFALNGNKPVAEFMFNHVLNSGKAHPVVEKITREQLQKLTAKPSEKTEQPKE